MFSFSAVERTRYPITRLVLGTYAAPPDVECILWLSMSFLISKVEVLALPEISE